MLAGRPRSLHASPAWRLGWGRVNEAAGFCCPQTPQLKVSAACTGKPAGAAPRLCQYLPAIEDEVVAHLAAVLRGCCLSAAAAVAVLALSSWYGWELCHVERRVTKYKRRRRHRKNG